MKEYQYKDPSTLTTLLQVLLVFSLLVSAAATASDFSEYQLLLSAQNGVEISPDDATANDNRQTLLGMLQFIVIIVTALTFLKWVYRMNRNAHALAPGELEISPPWAVGYFFVPVLNLWKPYQAMSAAYQVFLRETEEIDSSWVLGVWWAFHIIGNILGQISMRLQLRASTLEDYITSSLFITGSDGFDVFLNAVSIYMVMVVTQACQLQQRDAKEQADQNWFQQ